MKTEHIRPFQNEAELFSMCRCISQALLGRQDRLCPRKLCVWSAQGSNSKTLLRMSFYPLYGGHISFLRQSLSRLPRKASHSREIATSFYRQIFFHFKLCRYHANNSQHTDPLSKCGKGLCVVSATASQSLPLILDFRSLIYAVSQNTK